MRSPNDVELVIEDELGDVKRLVELAEGLAQELDEFIESEYGGCSGSVIDNLRPQIQMIADTRKVVERLKGRL